MAIHSAQTCSYIAGYLHSHSVLLWVCILTKLWFYDWLTAICSSCIYTTLSQYMAQLIWMTHDVLPKNRLCCYIFFNFYFTCLFLFVLTPTNNWRSHTMNSFAFVSNAFFQTHCNQAFWTTVNINSCCLYLLTLFTSLETSLIDR